MYTFWCCQDSVVGIATRYRLDGPGIESQCGGEFPHPSRPALRPTLLHTQCVLGLFPGDVGHGIDHPPPSNAEVKERVELYLCSIY